MGGIFSALGGRVAGSIEDAGMGGMISSMDGKMLGGEMPIPGVEGGEGVEEVRESGWGGCSLRRMLVVLCVRDY